MCVGCICHLESDNKADPMGGRVKRQKTRCQGFLVIISELLNQQASLKAILSGVLETFELSLKSFVLKKKFLSHISSSTANCLL